MRRKRKKKMSNKTKEIILLFLIILVIILGIGVKKYLSIHPIDEIKDKIIKEEKKLKIIDLNSTTRPVGVMIDNVKTALPQAGLSSSYLVYEIIVEGGFTRLFALYKDVDTQMIGPVRSLRHYFIDYALENDAVIAHYGWSPKAETDIKKLGVKNLNGLTNPGNMYYRNSEMTKAPHNAFTSMDNIRKQIDKLNYDKKVSDTLLNYSVDEIDLSKEEDSIIANNISIKYSNYQTTSYEYDVDKKVYKRYTNGKAQIDRNNNEQISAKNIIVYNVKNYPLADVEDKDRQELENIGSGDGYFITDGYAIPITYEKSSRSSKTKYKYLNGEEIKVNDGITYIQIQPTNQTTIIN